MPSSSTLAELPLAAFVERVLGAEPVPASGSVAALQGALGAALVSMAFHHAAGEGRSEVGLYMEGRARELEQLANRLLALVDEDARVYQTYVAAAPAERTRAAQAALETPLEAAETALAALRLAAAGAPQVREALRSECAVGVGALDAALTGALLLVRANAASVGDEEWSGERLAIAVELEQQARALVAEIQGAREAGDA